MVVSVAVFRVDGVTVPAARAGCQRDATKCAQAA